MTTESLLSLISNDLCIPNALIRCKSEKEAIVLVEKKWLSHLQENNTIEKCNEPENSSQYQLSAELHHSTFVTDGYVKLFILLCDQKNSSLWVDQVNGISKDTKLAKTEENLAVANFLYSWKHAYMKHKDCYIIENPENNENEILLLHNPENLSNGLCENEENNLQDNDIDCAKIHVCITSYDEIFTNCLPPLVKIEFAERSYLIKKCILHSVYDAVMYSPTLLSSSNARPLFLYFQLLKMMNFVCINFTTLELTSLTWRKVALDELLWIQADIHEHELCYWCSSNNDEAEKESVQCFKNISCSKLNEVTDLWVCGQLSNYDYLMHLNKLAGRRFNDPNHHPILPWVSNLSMCDGGWRDLTKSKYRLNKGDDQLELQYAMAANENVSSVSHNTHVPHHVPDMLSDITFYVYKARTIPQDILQKHVRSYWEPNEYPSSIQRMQEWTPDECIPEFYNDPSIFTSLHQDMADLSVPDWCESPEDFVSKHMDMLESDPVSSHLHDWIDITFGYKLSGKQAIQSLNVCRQLVDQHTKPVTQGIVQLFNSPHPQKRMSKPYLPNSILARRKLDAGKVPLVNGKENKEATEIRNSNSNEKLSDVFKSEESAASDDGHAEVRQVIRLPDDYEPFAALEQLEKLYNFKVFELEKLEASPELQVALQSSRDKMVQSSVEEITADRNMLVLMCLTVELFMIPHINCVSSGRPLSERFEAAVLSFRSNRHLFPITVRRALDYLLSCLIHSVERTCEELEKDEASLENGVKQKRNRIFKNSNSRNYPPPCPGNLLSEPMQIVQFPVYFHELHSFIDQLVKLTRYYQLPLQEENFDAVELELINLLRKLHGCPEGMDILMPHVVRLLEQPIQCSVNVLLFLFNHIAQELGPENTCKQFLPTIVTIYNKTIASIGADASDSEDLAASLCEKSFLVQLHTRLGLINFMDTFPRLITEALVKSSQCYDTIMSSVRWLLSSLGPTLASKYVIRQLLLSLNASYCTDSDGKKYSSDTHCQRVIDCLIYAASLYGSVLFTLQYIPHISFSVSSAISGTCFTDRSYAALEASTTLLAAIVPYLSDHALIDQLNRLSKEIIMPLIGVISSEHVKFPAGGEQRKYLCLKTINLLVCIALCMGRDMSRMHLTELLHSFFSNFLPHNTTTVADVHDKVEEESYYFQENGIEFDDLSALPSGLEPELDSITAAVQLGGLTSPINGSAADESFQNETSAKPKRIGRMASVDAKLMKEINDELCEAFCPETACHAYIPFARLMGGIHMERILKGHHDIVRQLSLQSTDLTAEAKAKLSDGMKGAKSSAEISSVGNRIVVEDKQDGAENSHLSIDFTHQKELKGGDSCYLKGNWLAYWEHEIGLASDDNHIHFNQIDLQSFQGHSAAVRSMYVSGSEEWFMSGSKDKTVKIWSLHCGGNEASQPLMIYRQHKKPVFYTNLVEADHKAISCDGSVHMWDPYTGQQISCLESNDFKANVVSLSLLPAPQRQLLVVTSDSSLKMVDLRTDSLAQEYKTVIGASVGMVRSSCTCGNYAAVGFSSGVLSLLDIRMGPILRMWQAHDSDIVASEYVTGNTFITASTDQTIAYWEAGTLVPNMVYRSIPEPVHVLRTFHNEILSASTSNRILVHTLPMKNSNGDATALRAQLDKPSAATKLRSDVLRGSLTTFSILPMKRQLLVASDAGAIKLLA